MNTIEHGLDLQAYRSAYVEFLASHNNQYVLTITFNRKLTERVVESSLQHFIRVLNGLLFGRRYLQKGLFLEGCAVIEYNQQGDCHFHFLIWDERGDLEARTSFKLAVEKARLKVRCNGRQNPLQDILMARKGIDAGCLISAQGVDLQPYYNKGCNRMEWYLTKILQARSLSKDALLDHLCVLYASGVNFGSQL